MNIGKQNALIAEFMGLSYCTKHNYEGWYKNNEHNHRICSYDGLEYHKDWNELMKVVQRIEEKGYVVSISGISCKIYPLFDEEENCIASYVCGDLSKKINIVHSSILDFIEWHNNQKGIEQDGEDNLATEENTGLKFGKSSLY